MKLAIYRNREDGKITRLDKVDEVPDIKEKAKGFNAIFQNSMVEVVELEENSLEMYLWDRTNLKIKEHKEDLEYMESQIRDLADCIAKRQALQMTINIE